MRNGRSRVLVDADQSWVDYWILLWIAAGLVGLVYSRFVLSMSIMGLSTLLLIPASRQGRRYPDIKRLAEDRRVWLGCIIIYLGVVLSGINSSDVGGWVHHLRIRLPLLTLPLALFSASLLQYRVLRLAILGFASVLVVSSLPIIYHYVTHYKEVQDAIGLGQAMDTPTSHIRYSLMIAFALLSTATIWWRERLWWQLSLAVWLLVFLHILAVRSGIAVLYLSSITIAVLATIKSKKWLRLVLVLSLLGAIGYSSTQLIPSLNRRLSYMRYDLKKYSKGDGKLYSDSERIASLKVGWHLTRQSPILGTGIGDLRADSKNAYEEMELTTDRPHLPHNQFLFISAGSGLLGLLIFAMGYGWLLWYARANTLAIISLVLVGSSFLVEHTLDTAVGVGFFSIILSICLWSAEASSYQKSPADQ